jgi:hypothetical protein
MARKGLYFTKYTTLNGGRRRVCLYQVWENLRARVLGRVKDGRGRAIWKGIEIGFKDFADFREWALSSGFGKEGRTSPDRKRSEAGYTRDNIQWMTPEDNRAKARADHKKACKCFWCNRR